MNYKQNCFTASLQRMLLFALFFIFTQVSAWAGPRSFQQAQAIAERQAAKLGIEMQQQMVTQARARWQQAQGAAPQSAPEYFVFNNGSNQGFTIVSGDDRMPEVVGYAAYGSYDETQVPAGCAEFLQAYKQMVEALNQGDAKANRLLAERNALQADGNYKQPVVNPLLGDIRWNQGSPYNNMCPEYAPGNRSVTGCVATAMAQVMMYYKYPKELKADIPAYTTKDYDISMPEISKGETYDWDNMLPSYSYYGIYKPAQIDAVAMLLLHCGAAVSMNYGPSSGSNLTPSTLATFFGYDADLMQFLYRSSYSLADWMQIIDRELTASRPILYRGSTSENSGHMYVCDGSDGNGYYHINWGWGGSSDGYFDISILDPSVRGAGSGSATDGYNRLCAMIIGIAPDNGKVDEPLVEKTALMVYMQYKDKISFPQDTRMDATGEFSVSISETLGNPSDEDFDGWVALGVKNADGSYQPISDKKYLGLNKQLPDGRFYINTVDFLLDYAFPVGITAVYTISSTDDGASWKVCRYNGTTPYQFLATATNLEWRDNFLNASFTGDEILSSKQNNLFEMNVENKGSLDYLGELKVYVNTTGEQPIFEEVTPEFYDYVCIPVGGKLSRSFYLSPSDCNLYVWLIDDAGNVLVDRKKYTVEGSSAPPILKLLSKKANYTENAYEKEKAYYLGAKRVELPRIDDDKAELTFSIKNDGGTYRTPVFLESYGYDDKNYYYGFLKQDVVLEGNGAITDVVFTLRPEDIEGRRSFKADLCIDDENNQSLLDVSAIKTIELNLVDNPGYCFEVTGASLVGYIAGSGENTGISSVQESEGLSVGAGNGVISIKSPESKLISIYQANGTLLTKVMTSAGATTLVPARPGIYIVAGVKVCVK